MEVAMNVVCGYCGLEGDIEIIGDDKHTVSFDGMNCRFVQEQASKPSGAEITGRCPHMEKAADEEVARYRQLEG
jgi:hypothetical protein